MTTNIEHERAAFEKWFSEKSHALSAMARNDSESPHQAGCAAHVVEQEPVARVDAMDAGNKLAWLVGGNTVSAGTLLYASQQPAIADDVRDAVPAYQKWMRDTATPPNYDDKRSQFESFIAGFAAAMKGAK